MTLDKLIPELFIVTAEIMDEIEATESAPAKYWPGVAYTSAINLGPELTEDQLANVIVGKQDYHSESNSPIEGEALQVAKKIQTKEQRRINYELENGSAKDRALKAQKIRVSRRLMLAERAKKITITCPVTGIISLLEIPSIPGKTLIYNNPISDLDNARGLAQMGFDYLNRLDTQVLAGILIVIASKYELFKFQPFDSGAQKNAILRTVYKDSLINAIIMIEHSIHSGNCSYLPKLSLILDPIMAITGINTIFTNYLNILAESIAKPDKEAYDPTIKKVGRPLYIKDEEKRQKKISFLARQEIAKAKKEYAEDRKVGKAAIVELCKIEKVTDKLKMFLGQLMAEDSLLTIPAEMIGLICMRLESYTSEPAKLLLNILKKDRKLLTMDISEIEDLLEPDEEDSEEEDNVIPGNEAAIEDNEEEDNDQDDTIPTEEDQQSGNESISQEASLYEPSDSPAKDVSSEIQQSPQNNTLIPPAGLTRLEQILWKKKIQAASNKPRIFVQNNLPSIATYIPSANKERLAKG